MEQNSIGWLFLCSERLPGSGFRIEYRDLDH